MFSITFIAFLLWIFRITLQWVSIWQVKEYRLDRLSVHIKETVQGKALFLSLSALLPWIVIFTYFFVILSDGFSLYFQLIVFLFFVLQALWTGKELFQRTLKRPVRTMKALAICSLSFITVLILSFFPLTDKYLWLLLLGVSTPLWVSFYIFFFSFPTEMYTDFLMQKAQRKMEKMKKVTVIAVSGSYGKSSTKEAIAHVLSQKYTVVKTPLSNNTPIAIAKTILEKIHRDTDFFVVEMGAYKKGEIAQLCSMVRPEISVTTAVSDQHMSLYGNMTDVISSEMELINMIPAKGLSLFNTSSPTMKSLYEKVKHAKVFYRVSEQKKKKNEIIASAVTATKDGVHATIDVDTHHFPIKTQLLGVHTIENILPAIYLGLSYGLTEEQIQEAVATLSPLPKTMVRSKLHNGAVAIDDTFNASPESVLSALSYMKLYNKKKIFVMTPLIELGKEGKRRHREIGESLALCDYLFLTNSNFRKELTEGIDEKKGKTQIIVESPKKIAEDIQVLAHLGDLVVFEGKEAGFALKKLL